MRKLLRQILVTTKDENFMHVIENVEVLVSKTLSIFMVMVILVAMPAAGCAYGDLGIFIFKELFTAPFAKFNTTLYKIFGLFLNILIAL